jgi:hypothetical protein
MGLAIILFSVFGLYLLVDIGRSIKQQLPAEYRWQAVRRTAVWLLCLELLVLIGTAAIELSSLSNLTLYYTIASLQLTAALVVLASTIRHLRTTQPPELANLAYALSPVKCRQPTGLLKTTPIISWQMKPTVKF